jgi:ABC-2 type transport system permease protein
MMGAPGSLVWLVHHNVRLGWRVFGDVLAKWSPAAAAAIILTVVAIVHAIAWAGVRSVQADPSLVPSPAAMAGFSGIALLWMISQGLLGATRSLYERGDLDVLLGSPLSVWKIVVTRAITIAINSAMSLATLVLPVAHVAAVMVGPGALLLYPLLVAFALIGAALGLALALLLLELLGPRRARACSNILAAIIAGGFVLGMQIVAVLPGAFLQRLNAWFPVVSPQSGSSLGQLVGLPVMAIQGDAIAALQILMVAIALFSLTILALAPTFARSVLRTAGADQHGAINRQARKRLRFREGQSASLRLKEWRLMTRDPNLLTQLGLQIIYTLPLGIILLKSEQGLPAEVALGPLIVVVAAQVAASLAWITVSGEDAPELIATAPVGRKWAELMKLSAIALPIALILCVPILASGARAYWVPLVITACAFGAATSTAVINLWHPMPGNRRGMLRRHSQSKVIAMAEHGLAILWAIVVVMTMVGTWFTVAPLVLIALIVWLFSPPKVYSRLGDASGGWFHFGRAARALKAQG